MALGLPWTQQCDCFLLGRQLRYVVCALNLESAWVCPESWFWVLFVVFPEQVTSTCWTKVSPPCKTGRTKSSRVQEIFGSIRQPLALWITDVQKMGRSPKAPEVSSAQAAVSWQEVRDGRMTGIWQCWQRSEDGRWRMKCVRQPLHWARVW